MKAKKVWIAVHPQEPNNFEVSFTEPGESDVWIYPDLRGNADAYVIYKEYALIELEE